VARAEGVTTSVNARFRDYNGMTDAAGCENVFRDKITGRAIILAMGSVLLVL
jgi:hypothetical protein